MARRSSCSILGQGQQLRQSCTQQVAWQLAPATCQWLADQSCSTSRWEEQPRRAHAAYARHWSLLLHPALPMCNTFVVNMQRPFVDKPTAFCAQDQVPPCSASQQEVQNFFAPHLQLLVPPLHRRQVLARQQRGALLQPEEQGTAIQTVVKRRLGGGGGRAASHRVCPPAPLPRTHLSVCSQNCASAFSSTLSSSTLRAGSGRGR